METVDNSVASGSNGTNVTNGGETAGATVAAAAAAPRLGRYRLVREIARSNDIVWEGMDPAMGRRVAVKELNLPTTLGDDARQIRIERFYREARAAGAMNHPHIVTIHEVGEDDGRFFIAMEFLEGETLRRRLAAQGKLTEQEAAQIGIALCEALEYAHGRGVIHRDIKPDNVFIHDSGGRTRVKLTDFGIARITHEETLTATGQFFGTPAYMSPEQLSGRGDVDARADLFALGVMLWEMVMGRKPFSGESVPATMFRILNDPTPLAENASPALQAVIERATAKNPVHRYQTAAELRDDLEPIAAAPAAATAAPAASGTRGAPLPPEEGQILTVEVADFEKIVAPLRPRLLAGLRAVLEEGEEAKKARGQGKLLVRPAPGGLLLAFFTGDPLAPVRCAVETDRAFRKTVGPMEQQVGMPLRLRMGVGSGAVQRTDDAADEVTGEGVTVTRRTLRLSDAADGGIMVTAGVAAQALQSPIWQRHLTDLAFRDAGDGLRLHVYNLHGVDFGSAKALPALGDLADPGARSGPDIDVRYRAPLPRALVPSLILLPLLGAGLWYGWKNQAAVTTWGTQTVAAVRRGLQPPPPAPAPSSHAGKAKPGKAGAPHSSRHSRSGGIHPAVDDAPPTYRADPFAAADPASQPRIARVTVPHLTGISQDAAQRRLDAAHLQAADAHTEYSPTIPEGLVFRQYPPAGTRLPEGSAVRLAVSLGPDPMKDGGDKPPAENPTPTPVPSEDDISSS